MASKMLTEDEKLEIALKQIRDLEDIKTTSFSSRILESPSNATTFTIFTPF